MSGFILDASVTLSWCFLDEATTKTDALLARLKKELAFAPELWTLEVGNILIMSEQRKRITYAQITEFLSLLSKLNIQVVSDTAKYGFHEILNLAHNEKITTYDAAYLELAMRLGKPLASKDKQLNVIAKRLGVQLMEI